MEQTLRPTGGRLKSIDLLRGIIMVLMAIDHVRVYAGVPAGGPTADLFFTRWITHFCAPGFAFFAGAGIFLFKSKTDNRKTVSGYLLTRGLLLVLLELTLIRLGWTFNLRYDQFILAGVIWMLGWCMVLMAIVIRIPVRGVLALGFGIVLFQQVFKYVPQIFPVSMQPSVSQVWNFLYPVELDHEPFISVLYVILPWLGVMCLGYGFGLVFQMEEQQRKRWCLWIGSVAIALWFILGSIMVLIAPSPANPLPFLFRLLNQGKYPPTPLFVLMTLGPLVLLIPFAEKWKGWFADKLSVVGRVPLMFYLLHIPLIHVLACITNLARDGETHRGWYGMAPFYTQQQEGTRWPLWLLYFVWAAAIAILYALCYRYARYKKRHPEKGWLKYI